MDLSRGFSFMENIIALCFLSTIGVCLLLQQGKVSHKIHMLHVRQEASEYIDYVVESFLSGSEKPEIPHYFKLTTQYSGNKVIFVLQYGANVDSYIQRQRFL